MADGWDEAVLLPGRVAALAERLAGEEVVYAIDSAWPRATGWSAANNRVRLGDASDFPVEPPTRPDEQGALFAFANANVERNVERLGRHVEPGLVAVGNAVPYARDVGGIDDNGALIYQEAGRTGVAVGVRRVGLEWQKSTRGRR